MHRLGKFRQALQERLNLSTPLTNADQLDVEIENFLIGIQQSAWKNTPEIRRRTNGNNYPKEIRQLMIKKKQDGDGNRQGSYKIKLS